MSGFGYLTSNDDDDHAAVVIVRPDGIERIELRRAEPSDREDAGVLYQGTLYGPATWADCHAAVLRLHRDADFAFGNLSHLRADAGHPPEQPLSALAAHYADPGEATGDD